MSQSRDRALVDVAWMQARGGAPPGPSEKEIEDVVQYVDHEIDRRRAPGRRHEVPAVIGWVLEFVESKLPPSSPYDVKIVRQIAIRIDAREMEYEIRVNAGPAPFVIPSRMIQAIEEMPEDYARGHIERELDRWLRR